VISVDTKKKELVGDFKNGGKEWHPKEGPRTFWCTTFPADSLGKGHPYGVYDMTRNEAWVSVGETRHAEVRGRVDPAVVEEMACAPIARRRNSSSRRRRRQQWLSLTGVEGELQALANRDQVLRIRVSHFPPGTSSGTRSSTASSATLTQNWRGKRSAPGNRVELIGHTRTATGLRVKAHSTAAISRARSSATQTCGPSTSASRLSRRLELRARTAPNLIT